MAGQRPRSANNGRGARRSSHLADALTATQQHSVPLLPASESTGPASASTRHTPTDAHFPTAPTAPGVPVKQRTPRARGTTEHRSAAHAAFSDAGRSLSSASAWPAYAEDARAGAAEGAEMELPGRPTIGLPTIPRERLPAVIAEPNARALATHADELVPALLIPGAKKPPRSYTLPVVPKRTGPRSFYAQFFASMMTAMVLFSALTLATPLGHSVAFANNFQSYASAVRWVPTPTPTPKPTPTPVPYAPPGGWNPGQQAVINDIVAVFGSYSQGALNVARCESGYDPNAYNGYAIGGSHAEGVFQILYPSTWSGTSYSAQSPYNYDANIHAAYEIFARDGHSWVEWACKP